MFTVSVDDHVAVIEFEFWVGAISDREMGSQVGGLRNKWNSPLRSLYQRPGGTRAFLFIFADAPPTCVDD